MEIKAAIRFLLFLQIYQLIRCTNSDSSKVPNLTARQKEDVKSFVEAVMQCSRIQGLTLAVVNKEEVIMLEGFGFADVDERRRVTPSTLFPVASATKGFTTTLLAMLLYHQSRDDQSNNQ